MPGSSTWALAATTLLLLTSCGQGFKEHEFKKCNDASFCRRLRGKDGSKYSVNPGSVSVAGATLTAQLQNDAAGKSFQLSLTAYADGFVRLRVDEDGAERYKVADILEPAVENRTQTWSHKQDASGLVLSAGSASVQLSFSPFRLAVSVDGKPAVSLNSRDMFDMEHKREKQEEDACDGCWEESFLGHQDTKPKGPQAISLDIAFPGSDHVYGIPERATSFSLKPTVGVSEPYRLYNLDVFEYLHESPFGLYGSIPMMLAHRAGLTTAVLWLNAAEMFVDVAKPSTGVTSQWIAESGIVDLFVFLGPKPADVARQYAAATGTTALPQLFSIGYHQCRWNYKDEEDVKQVDAGFDQHEIPYDVIWLDIEHTNGKRYLTWDSSVFPNPAPLQEDVASRGRRTVTIVDPHVKRDHSYYIFSEADKAGYYVQNRDGGAFDGWCWPGSSSYLDVTSPAVREWWAQQFALDKYQGSTKHLYIWNDMNEPSVFNGPEITMPKDNIHWGGAEHRDVHNLYGLYYHQGTADGLKLRGWTVNEDGDRPFVLSRAFFSGTQRVGPIWTGDNFAQWEHLRVSVPMLLALGVTGLPFSGADVGGFFGNPDAELLTRWYQVGTYYPFFRGHAHLDTQRREPWLFGEDATRRIRNAIRARYALLPYMYTLFRAANTTGDPIMRPLWYEFPDQKELFAVEEEFMVGPAMLVRPVLEAGASTVDALLPRDSRWYSSLTGKEMGKSTWLSGGDQVHRVKVDMEGIPVFYRGGHVVPRRERPRRATSAMARDPVTLVVALDAGGKASGDLYLDDGSSFAFQKGQYVHRRFSFDGQRLTSSAVVEHGAGVPPPDAAGAFAAKARALRVERVVFLGLPKAPRYTATVPGHPAGVPLEQGPLSMVLAPSSTDAWVLRAPGLSVGEDWVVDIQGK